MYLEKITCPADVKSLGGEELKSLAQEMRDALLKKLSIHGGHFGPNFGMVEATIALHYVFDSPKDKIVFDVSHQSYCHKMLTGRADAFLYEEKYDDVSGYSNPDESEHDFFTIGHTSTSVSLASGMAKARDLNGETGNVVAVIGDGSLSGGEALEALDFAGEFDGNFIIVVNDNDMSIAENHGGIYKNLKQLRESNGECACNLFKAMGLDYVYVSEGNDIQKLIEAFKGVKDSEKPVVVHICTEKGLGYKLAEENKEMWHWCMPFDLETGECKIDFSGVESYDDLTVNYLLEKMKKDSAVTGITSGTPAVFGFTKENRIKAGKQFVDVGIAEEHAVAMASGIAKNGGKPVYGVYSTFLQRTYDQIAQDVCINNSAVTFVVFSASVYGMNDVTHLGIYDIPMISNIPNLVYLAPTSVEEYFAMLEWAIEQNEHPVAVRVPGNGVVHSDRIVRMDYSELNKFQMDKKGSRVAIVALGGAYQLGEEVIDRLSESGINATLINPVFVTGIDSEMLCSLEENHELVVTVEDGVLDGGFGEKISRFYGSHDMKVLNFGLKKEFPDRYDVSEYLKENHMTAEQICADIKSVIS